MNMESILELVRDHKISIEEAKDYVAELRQAEIEKYRDDDDDEPFDFDDFDDFDDDDDEVQPPNNVISLYNAKPENFNSDHVVTYSQLASSSSIKKCFIHLNNIDCHIFQRVDKQQTITADLYVPKKYQDEFNLSYESHNQTATFQVTEPNTRLYHTDSPAQLYILIPVNISIEISSQSATIHLNNISNNSFIPTDSGDILSHQNTGNMQLQTDSGDIHIYEYRSQNLGIKTDCGNIRIANSETDHSIISNSGNVSLSGFSGIANISSDSGNVELMYAEDCHFHVFTKSGDIRLEDSYSIIKECNLTSTTGDIVIADEDFPLSYDIETIHGKVELPKSIPFPQIQVDRQNTDSFHVKIASSSDNIVIKTFSGDITFESFENE